jgi:hypothetical protein
MTRAERTRIVNVLLTAEDLIRYARRRLESDVPATNGMLRDVQAHLESAERIVAVAAQDLV